MNNGKPSPSLAVAVLEKTAFIKIPGRANFTSSIEFKTIVGELRQRGFERFILDLRECVTMDSTFLGVLAGLALRNADGQECTTDGEKLQLSLLNPNERIADLLENLGVVHLFAVMNEEVPCTVLFEPAKGDQRPPTREAASEETRSAAADADSTNGNCGLLRRSIPSAGSTDRFFWMICPPDATGAASE